MEEHRQDRPMTEHVWRLAGRLERLLVRFGIGASFARIDRGAALETALRRCEACRDEAACEAWLARLERGAEPDDLTPPDYCPNRKLIEQALAEQKSLPAKRS